MAKKLHEMDIVRHNSVDTGSRWSNIDGVVMELWTRRPVVGPRTEVVDRLTELKSSGAIAEFSIKTWPDEIVISDTSDDRDAIEAYESFMRWGTENDISITPSFESQSPKSLIGSSEETVTVPTLCLAVYDGKLKGVFPHQTGDRKVSVTDFLDAYESGEEPPADVTDLSIVPSAES